MKKLLIILGGAMMICQAQVGISPILGEIKNSAEQVKGIVDVADDGSENKQEAATSNNSEAGGGNQPPKSNPGDSSKIHLKAYQNYDFVAGEKILFEDHFLSDMDGEFPAHWDLISGQAVVNQEAGKKTFLITDGNYCRIIPLIKNQHYLSNEFTLEFDYYPASSSYGLLIGFFDDEGNEGDISISSEGIGGTFGEKYLFGTYPIDLQQENYFLKWHHVALAYKNNQLKVYMDVERVLTMPNIGMQPVSLDFHGIGDPTYPIMFTHVKIAEGGKMNMLDKLFTDGKIITHGILFDHGKSTIKPESMGVINQVFQLLKDNPELKFEIGGYTDSDGDDQTNLKLSEQRANAVKEQLVSMGISADRLITKGFGEANPVDINTTMEGKANNRRVEFTKR